ncbi:MAG: bifunctional adenosylcobinamide kinase/adenosylcobinamide-phosphate guanylyltransferase [Candidatus Binatus sp.]
MRSQLTAKSAKIFVARAAIVYSRLFGMGTITLITGGARSGKSMQALKLALSYQRKFFVATGQALDDEMTARIEFHRTTRPPDFQTVEEPIQIVAALERLDRSADLVVLDCLTLWISNLMLRRGADGGTVLAEADRLATALKQAPFASIVVTDEVGSGIVPTDHAESRRFRDLLGWTNQKIAAAADQVLLMVAGYPLKLK